LSYLQDVLSGKIYRQNKLVGRNLKRILEKVYSKEDPNIIKDWVISFCISCKIFFDAFLFERPIERNTLSQNQVRLFPEKKKLRLNIDQDAAFNSFKALARFHLSIFLSDEDNCGLLNRVDLSIESFEMEILKILDFTGEDIDKYYRLCEISGKDVKRFFYSIFNDFAMPFGINQNDPIEVVKFTEMLKEIYLEVFIKSFSESYHKHFL